MKCQHNGCQKEDATECRLGGQPETDFSYYCIDHCKAEGFCYGCGDFWAGVETFDFPVEHGNIPGLCENCSDQLRTDCGECDDTWR